MHLRNRLCSQSVSDGVALIFSHEHQELLFLLMVKSWFGPQREEEEGDEEEEEK